MDPAKPFQVDEGAGQTIPASMAKPGLIRRKFEGTLWDSRVVVIVPVVASLIIAFAMFYSATIDTIRNYSYLHDYMIPSAFPEVHEQLRSDLITHVVEALDGYLLGIVMLIFSMGLYELFIHRLDPAVGSDRAKRILLVHSLDDLKSRLGQVILLMLVVKFFENALSTKLSSTLDLLTMSAGILLIAVALRLSHIKEDHEADDTSRTQPKR